MCTARKIKKSRSQSLNGKGREREREREQLGILFIFFALFAVVPVPVPVEKKNEMLWRSNIGSDARCIDVDFGFSDLDLVSFRLCCCRGSVFKRFESGGRWGWGWG